VRIVSWNMGLADRTHSRHRLHDQAWHYLLGLGPDLAFVQEALPPTWVRSEGTLIRGPFSQWGSAIFSPRYPLERLPLPEDSPLRRLGSYLAFGIASLPDGSDAVVASVHAVDRKASPAQLRDLDPAEIARSPGAPVWISDLVFSGLVKLVRDGSFIAAGDWNTAHRFPASRTSAAASRFFERAKEHGWFECLPEEPGEAMRTWFRAGDEPSQIDHVFCDAGLADRRGQVRVAADAAEDLRLSDHAPLIADFDVQSIAMTNLDAEAPDS
jgi:endonuclease/exonuclease/phosphatase (EEP) superfamily protein YafD